MHGLIHNKQGYCLSETGKYQKLQITAKACQYKVFIEKKEKKISTIFFPLKCHQSRTESPDFHWLILILMQKIT